MRALSAHLLNAVNDQIPEVGRAAAAAGQTVCRESMCEAVAAERQFKFTGYVGSLDNNLSGVLNAAGILKRHIDIEL